MNMSDTSGIDDCADWVIPDFGSVHNPTIKKITSQGLPTADDIENIYQEARKEGYAKGYDSGLDEAKADINSKIKAMAEFMQILEEPYKQISGDVIDTIKHISIVIAGQIVRREINYDENNVIAAIKKSLSLVDEIVKPMVIHVNPEDIAIVKDYLSNAKESIKFIDDVTISRGGCRIDTSMSIIDATIESQLTEIASELIGGSRIDDD